MQNFMLLVMVDINSVSFCKLSIVLSVCVCSCIMFSICIYRLCSVSVLMAFETCAGNSNRLFPVIQPNFE